MTSHEPSDASVTRRTFVKSSAVSVGALAIPVWATPRGNDPLHVGLVGCGGRGTGAATQALTADPNVVLHAMADAFPDRLESCLSNLRQHRHADRINVPAERRFTGFDAYQRVMESDVDVVLLATPPHFRPAHVEAAVEAGKHIFCEKPVAVDAPGVRRVRAAARTARERGLSVMSGFCWRYSYPERETYQRVHDGAIGEVVSMHATYHTGPLWTKPRQPGWSDMEWQLRNWPHFTWLSGDHIVEQACHSVDKINWGMGGEMPVRATALGGRGVRQGPESGNIYDHFAVIYEYEDGARTYLTCRQQANCSNDNSDYIIGTRGKCFVNGWAPRHEITGPEAWTRSRDAPRPNMYQNEHNELFAAIRSGEHVNDGEWMCDSTLMAIMGRMAAYTGQTITWDQARSSTEDLSPPVYEFGSLATPPIARPGETPFV